MNRAPARHEKDLLARCLRAERRARALVEAGAAFAAGRPVEEALGHLAERARDALAADLVLVHLGGDREPKAPTTDAVAAALPELGDMLRDHLAAHPVTLDATPARRTVVEARTGLLLPEVHEDDLARLARPVDRRLFDALGIRSAVVVPLRGQSGIVGALEVVTLGPGRPFDREDFSLAQEIADRAGAAVEVSRLLERLERERALLEHVIEQMPEGVVILDGAGRLVLANRVAQGVVGFELEAGAPLVQAERVVRRRADGAEIPILVNSAPVLGREGEVESRVAVFQDVSERKRSERRLAELAEVADARARRLEGIISRIADGVLVADAGGRVVLANDAAAQLFGVPREELLRPLSEFSERFAIRDEEGRAMRAVGSRALAGLLTVGAERVIRDPSGNERHLRTSAAPLRDDAARVEGCVIVCGDITAQKALERAREEFLEVASHELKTPLTPLLANVELIARSVEAGRGLDPALGERVRRQAARLAGLIDDLLDATAARAGRLEVEREAFALRLMLERVVEEVRPTLTRHEIAWRAPDQPVTVRGDERRLEEVVLNLLDNAAKYSPEGGTIEVALTTLEDGRVEVSVADPGIGIAAADVPHVFDRFRRGRNVSGRHFGGLGLGLFISRAIVRAHDGEIRIESEQGRGTRASFTLPVA